MTFDLTREFVTVAILIEMVRICDKVYASICVWDTPTSMALDKESLIEELEHGRKYEYDEILVTTRGKEIVLLGDPEFAL